MPEVRVPAERCPLVPIGRTDGGHVHPNPAGHEMTSDTPIILTPGVYDLPNEVYHADPCQTPSLSAAGAWTIDTECPAEFWRQTPRLNPKAEREGKPHFAIGSAAHVLALQPDRFQEEVYVLAEDHNPYTKEGKATKAAALESGKTVITHDEFLEIKEMAQVLAGNELAQMAFSAGRPEQSIFWQDRETGVWCRCRPDWLPNRPLVIPDYKTAISVNPRKFERQACDFGHHVRAAHYLAGVAAIFGGRPIDYLFIVQRKTAPYPVVPIILHADAIEWGEKIRRRSLRIFARCLETERWPDYAGADPVIIGLPGYEERRLKDLDTIGYFDIPKETPHEQAPDHLGHTLIAG